MIASEEPVMKQDWLPSVEGSPFDLTPDPEGDKNALTKALQIVKDFALHFVVSEVSRVRPRLMEEIEARLPGKNIQRIHITKETTNLLHLLQVQLQDPLPDAVFVSGFENIISAVAQPRSHPLLLNLNATRNNFYALLPRPVVLWVPPFAMRVIAQAAPDFVSVRSGVYTFSLSPEEREQMKKIVSFIDQRKILGLGQLERANHIAQMQSLLSEYRTLPVNEQNPQDEALILNQLGIAYTTLGDYAQAEPLLDKALSIRRAGLPAVHPDVAIGLNNLASLYKSQGHYNEAEPLFNEALSIRRANLPEGHPTIAASLNNLASLYDSQGRYDEAEALYDEALSIRRDSLPEGHPDIALSLNNLASLYDSQGRYAEAELLLHEALSINRANLPTGHPNTAANLNNLALLYKYQGRYAEAESLYAEALSIARDSLPVGHPDIAASLNNLATLYGSQGRYAEAEPFLIEAVEILQNAYDEEHPLLQVVRSNFENFQNGKVRFVAPKSPLDARALSYVFSQKQQKTKKRKPEFKPLR